LLKFHCELNFIDFFWGTVKKNLHKNCDNTYDKGEYAKGTGICPLADHLMVAYQLGLGTTDAHMQVRQFSSRKYKSHRCVPETVVHVFD
jgi:hypothetical protein